MKVRKLVACSLVTPLFGAAWGVTAAPSVAADGAPRVLSGVVETSAGLPAAGATVDITALTVDDGPSRDEVPLGSTMADTAGNFVVTGELPAGQPIVTSEGTVELIVRAHNAVEGVITGAQAQPPGALSSDWTLRPGEEGTLDGVTLTLHNLVTGAVAERPLALGSSQQEGSSAMAATSASSSVFEPGGESEGYVETTEGSPQKPSGTEIALPAQLTTALAASGACPQGYTVRWFKTGKYRYSYVPVQYVNTGNRSSFTYYYDETNSTDLEVTYVRDGDGWSGGLSSSRGEKDGVAFQFDFGNNARRIAKLEWKYQRIDQYCIPQGPVPYYATGLVRWEPEGIASGSRKRDTTYNFDCQAAYKSDLAATTSVVRSSYISWGGWFSIAAGYRADLTQRNDTTEKLVFTPNAGQTATLCGSDAKPIEANLVKETS